jgi:hypothetical protein
MLRRVSWRQLELPVCTLVRLTIDGRSKDDIGYTSGRESI